MGSGEGLEEITQDRVHDELTLTIHAGRSLRAAPSSRRRFEQPAPFAAAYAGVEVHGVCSWRLRDF